MVTVVSDHDRTRVGDHCFQVRQRDYVAQPPARTRKRTLGHANLGDHPSPGLVCQECHRLIDRPLAVNRCPLCKVDLHTGRLDVHFLLVHKESFERWNKNTLEASSLFGTSSRASPFPSSSTLSLQFALHSAPMAAAFPSGCGPQPFAQTRKRPRASSMAAVDTRWSGRGRASTPMFTPNPRR